MCVDLIVPYINKAKDKTVLGFMCLTMINPAIPWFEIVELPTTEVQVVCKSEEIVKISIDKSSACMTHLFNKPWLSCCPRANNIIYDSGSKFKLFSNNCANFHSNVSQPQSIIRKQKLYLNK